MVGTNRLEGRWADRSGWHRKEGRRGGNRRRSGQRRLDETLGPEVVTGRSGEEHSDVLDVPERRPTHQVQMQGVSLRLVGHRGIHPVSTAVGGEGVFRKGSWGTVSCAWCLVLWVRGWGVLHYEGLWGTM